MTLRFTTYQQALDAIERSDGARVKQLMVQPVKATHRKGLEHLKRLVGEAAARGQREVVHHLLALGPGSRDREASGRLVTEAWIAAIEAQQRNLAWQLHGMLPPCWSPLAAEKRYVEVVQRGAWRSAEVLLREGHQPDSALFCLMLTRMGEEVPERQAMAREVLGTLLPRVPPDSLVWAARAALHLQDDHLFQASLAGASRTADQGQDKRLRETAVDMGRHDLFEQVLHHFGITLSVEQWVKQITVGPNVGHLRFSEALLDHHPEVVAYLRDHGSDAEVLGWRVLQVAVTHQESADALDEERLRRLFQVVCDTRHVENLKAYVVDHVPLEHGLRCLNHLAGWVPQALRDRWCQEAPVTFAETIARLRAETALDAGHGSRLGAPVGRRPRVRA